MSRRLVVAAAAEADLRAAFLWYERRVPGLGRDFMRRVEAKIELIQRSPQLFRIRYDEYRLAATERFPYGIYFVWDEVHDVIAIRRVLHFKQDSRAAG